MVRRNGVFRQRAVLAVVLLTTLLVGCVAPKVYQQGVELSRTGRHAEALAKYQEALRLEPNSAEYRLAHLRTREQLVAEYLTAAEQARDQGELDVAETAYGKVLALAGPDARALAGLRTVDTRRRWERALQEAESAAARKDWDRVRAALRPILLENPKHARAGELLSRAERAAEAAAPKIATALAEAYRRPISIEFRDTQIKTVFEVISRTSGLNFIFDKDVRGDQKTSIFLRNSTIDAAVNMLLVTNQLARKVLDANSILIYPNVPAKQREYQRLTVRSFYLGNADAKTVAATLKSLLKARDPVIDEKLNLVIVRDSPQVVRLAERIVALHDVPEAEVMLDVEILEVKRTRLMDLGVRWPDQVSLSPLPGVSGGQLTLQDLRHLNAGTVGATVGPLSISARATDTDANILANPRIRARNREKAKVHIGERVPNITTTATSTGFVSESVTYVDIGLKLDVEPTIYLDNEVAIKVSLEVSNIINQVQTKAGTLAYQIGTRTATTVLRLKDGENQVLAGLINDEDRRTGNKVPALGEAPIVGRLFGNQVDDSAKTEIVLSITPRVLRNVQRPESDMLEFDSGTEANTGVGATDPVGAWPAALPRSTSPAAPSEARPPTSSAAPSAPDAAATPLATTASPQTTVVAGQQVGAVVTRWLGPATGRVGETVAVRLVAAGDSPVTAMPLVIGFDPRILQVTSLVEGDFLRQGGVSTTFSTRIDPAGQLVVTMVRGGGTGASTEAAALEVNFRVLGGAGSETRIELRSLSPTGLQGRALAGPLPTPHVLAVLP